MPIRILIVDDHQMMCDGLRVLLERFPEAEVVGTCGESATAFRLVGELRPEVVLMDVDLPDGSGIALTRRIVDAFPAVKVLVLTAHLEGRYTKAALEAGACGYLVKTNASDELFDAVRTVVSGGIYVSAGKAEARWASRKTEAEAATVGGGERALPLRERQVLERVLRGLRNKEIAAELNLGVKTVETYRARLMKRFECKSVAELVQRAVHEGFAAH